MILCLALLLLVGCATTTKCPTCPDKDCVLMLDDGTLLYLQQGYLDDPENSRTLEQLEKMHRDFMENYNNPKESL